MISGAVAKAAPSHALRWLGLKQPPLAPRGPRGTPTYPSGHEPGQRVTQCSHGVWVASRSP